MTRAGLKGTGKYYLINIRPKSRFVQFRNQDVGVKGGLIRTAGKTPSGTWLTQRWMVEKEYAKPYGDKLVGLVDDVKELFKQIGSPIKSSWGEDLYKAHPRQNVPEYMKPTLAQHKGWKVGAKKRCMQK